MASPKHMHYDNNASTTHAGAMHMHHGYRHGMPKVTTKPNEAPTEAQQPWGEESTPTITEQVANILAKEYVHKLMVTNGLRATEIAHRAGLHQTTVTRPMNDPTGRHPLTARTMRLLEQAFDIPLPPSILDALPAGRASRDEVVSRTNGPRRRAAIRPGPTDGGGEAGRDVPIYGALMVGAAGGFRVNPIALDYAPRPAAIQNARKVYALRMPDASMWPWRQVGELVYLDPARPVAAGNHALLECHSTARPNDPPIFLVRHILQLPTQPGEPPKVETYAAPGETTDFEGMSVTAMTRVLEWAELVAG